MNPKLHSLFEALEKERTLLLTAVKSYPADTLSHTPRPGKWSVLQILTHLVISEQLSLLYMQKKSLGVQSAGDTTAVESIKSWLLLLSQRLPLKYKAPKFLKESTPGQWPVHEIEANWQTLRQQMHAFLSAIEPAHLKRKIYRHPVAGRLNVTHALLFMRAHIRHHQPQVKRLLK
ncbi:MAG: DinB family protein [Bacteroidia bacterium]|nr:DinB family protein [Bacteroidia bacterium]